MIRIKDDTTLQYSSNFLTIYADPPTGAFSPAALGLFLQANSKTAIIFYTISYNLVGESALPLYNNFPIYNTFIKFDAIDRINNIVIGAPNTYVAYNTTPYIHLITPYGKGRNIKIVAIAVDHDSIRDIWYKSNEYVYDYIVEAAERPKRLLYYFIIFNNYLLINCIIYNKLYIKYNVYNI